MSVLLVPKEIKELGEGDGGGERGEEKRERRGMFFVWLLGGWLSLDYCFMVGDLVEDFGTQVGDDVMITFAAWRMGFWHART